MSDEAIRVKVVCRVRPLNEKERASGDKSCVSFPSASCVALGVSVHVCVRGCAYNVHVHVRTRIQLCTRTLYMYMVNYMYMQCTCIHVFVCTCVHVSVRVHPLLPIIRKGFSIIYCVSLP